LRLNDPFRLFSLFEFGVATNLASTIKQISSTFIISNFLLSSKDVSDFLSYEKEEFESSDSVSDPSLELSYRGCGPMGPFCSTGSRFFCRIKPF
jgi:hypothetical protein